MTPEQRLHVEEWIGRLRSGAYPQVKARLHRPGVVRQGIDEGYCCLGVLCETAGLPQPVLGIYDIEGVECSGSVDVRWFGEYTGLAVESDSPSMSPAWAAMERLIYMNDHEGASFDEIADTIKDWMNAV